jgi:hypothetical protein
MYGYFLDRYNGFIMTLNTLPPLQFEPLALAEELHQQAGQLLSDLRLVEIITPYGLITPTGSYFLNVMVYPDLDMYLPRLSIEQLFAVGGQLAQADGIVQVVFEQNDDMMPGGLYLKLRIANKEWSRPWKIDLWAIDSDLLEQKMTPMRHFMRCLTPELRLQIIRYKLSVLTPAGRTPMYSGYFIYKAFIDEGLSDFDQVTRYLVENRIQVG